MNNNIDKLTQAEIRLSEFLTQQIKNSTTYFGYPEIPKNNDLSILGISGLAKLHLNNAGDPYIHGNAKMHTKEFEREVLSFVAKLYNLNSYWGYVTSGGTEGNLYGAYMGRDYFKNLNKKPFLLSSCSSHYSIAKNAHLLNIDYVKVNSQKTGELDYTDLKNQLKNIIESHTDYGIIINLNIGTTMTGAMDELIKTNEIIDSLNISRENVFIHADAALMGFIYPFLTNKIDLFKNGINSIAISGHKFPGTIHPCGVFLTKKTIHDQTFKESWVPYVGTNDTTISGSRNGFLALNFWYIIQKKGVDGFQKDSETCIENAIYLYEKLQELKYPEVAYNPNQIIVTFKKPSDEIVQKYQLATQKDKAHVVVMQHINKKNIDTFCQELLNSIK